MYAGKDDDLHTVAATHMVGQSPSPTMTVTASRKPMSSTLKLTLSMAHAGFTITPASYVWGSTSASLSVVFTLTPTTVATSALVTLAWTPSNLKLVRYDGESDTVFGLGPPMRRVSEAITRTATLDFHQKQHLRVITEPLD